MLDAPDVLAVLAARLPEWHVRGSCRGEDPELWFPGRGDPATRAKAICAGCPVRGPCLDYAITERIGAGIFGGLSNRERVKAARTGERPRCGSCDACGAGFVTMSPSARFCGPSCRLSATHEARRAEGPERPRRGRGTLSIVAAATIRPLSPRKLAGTARDGLG